MLLEVDPKATTFCEQPGEVQFNARNRFADFGVRCIDRD
jgi:hypothetical protein